MTLCASSAERLRGVFTVHLPVCLSVRLSYRSAAGKQQRRTAGLSQVGRRRSERAASYAEIRGRPINTTLELQFRKYAKF